MISRRAVLGVVPLAAKTGVRSVQLVDGDAVWEDKRWSRPLLVSALSRSDSPQGLTIADARTQELVGSGELRKLVKNPAAYFIERNDGLRTTLLMLNGALKDYNFAARIKGKGIASTQFFLSPTPNVTYSACLVSKIEELFLTGKAPYPVERTLIVSGMLESCLQSRKAGGKLLATPHLGVRYQGTRTAQHARG